MPAKKLMEFLDSHHIKYVCMVHSPAFTAQEIAAAAHVSGRQLAKAVMVNADHQLVMVVLPANEKVHLEKLKNILGVKQTELALESEFKQAFPGCEVGALPPFGNLFDIPVYISTHLTKNDHILFNAGTYSELMEISFPDFERLVKPKVIAI